MIFPAEPGCRGGVVCCRDNVDGSAGFAQARPMLNADANNAARACCLDCSLALNDRAMLSASSPAKAGDPVFRDASDGSETLRHTGYPACAGYDGLFRPCCAFFVMRKMSRKAPRKIPRKRKGKCQEKAVTMANFRHTITAKLHDPR
jgi:hypothetical protein